MCWRKVKNFLPTIILGMFFVAISTTFAAPKDEFVTALTGKFPPFNYYNEQGELAGFDVDVSREIAKRLKSMALPETDLVLGIGTGGIVPASLVAFHLNAELQVMVLNYRDEQNTPRYDQPRVLQKPGPDLEGKRILLVDDVSVSGKTLDAAMQQLKGLQVKTLTMKGKADYVLFPEIKDCVKWPWKIY